MFLGIFIYLTNKNYFNLSTLKIKVLVVAKNDLCALGTNEVIKINNKFKGEKYDNTKFKNIT